MSSIHIARCGVLLVAVLVLAPFAGAQTTTPQLGEILINPPNGETFNQQLNALLAAGINDILIEGPHDYTIDQTIVVDATLPDGLLVLSGEPENEPQETVLTDSDGSQGFEEPVVFSFPIYPEGNNTLAPSGCVKASVRKLIEVDPADNTQTITTYEATFDVAYDDADLAGSILSFEVFDGATPVFSRDATETIGGDFVSSFIVKWSGMTIQQGTDLLAENYTLRLATGSVADYLEGDIIQDFCNAGGFDQATIWSFPVDQLIDTALNPAPVACATAKVPDDKSTIRFVVDFDPAVITNLTQVQVLDGATLVEDFFAADTDAGNMSPPVSILWTAPDATTVVDPLLSGSFTLRLITATSPGGAIEGDIEDSSCDLSGTVVAPSPSTMFDVEAGGTLRLDNLAISAKDVGIRVYPGGTVDLNRVYIRDCGRYGVDFVGGGTEPMGVFVNCSVVRNGEDGIHAADGSLTIQQCSFLDNGGAGVRMTDIDVVLDAVASLFHNNDIGIEGTVDADPDNSNFVATGCWFIEQGTQDYTDDVTIVDQFLTSMLPGAAQDPDTIFPAGAAWRGKLEPNPVFGVLPAWSLIPSTATLPVENGEDFEGQIRDPASEVYIGADEPGDAFFGTGVWVDCDINTPRLPLGGVPVATAGDTVQVRVETRGLNLNGAVIHVIHELGAFPANVMFTGIPVAVSTLSTDVGFSSFTIPQVANVYDGRAAILLEVQGTVYGIPPNHFDPANPTSSKVTRAAEYGRFFIIDSTAPGACTRVLNGSPTNDLTPVPPGQGINPTLFVPDWAGQYASVPASLGSMTDPNRDPQLFFNVPGDPTVAGNTLDFTLELCFVDKGIGFADAIFQPQGTFNGGAAMFAALTLPFAVLNPPQGAVGTVWWDPNETSVQSLIANQPNTASVTIFSNVLTSAQTPDGYPRLEMTYAFTGLEYPAPANPNSLTNFHLVANFVAQDLGGNLAEIPRSVHIWWFPNDLFRGCDLTTQPGGYEVVDPVITWDIDRAAGPVDAYPAYPMARFRLFRVEAGNIFVPLGISDWFRQRTIDRFTRINNLVTPALRLGDVLDDPANLNKPMIMQVVVADEAGNVEGFPGCEARWINKGQSSSLETSIQPRYWHNETILPDPRVLIPSPRPVDNLVMIEPDFGEIDFGSSARIPLTPPGSTSVGTTQRVEATFEIAAGVAGAQTGTTRIDWELFEDGIRVASGSLIPSRVNNRVTLTVPTEFLDPAFIDLNKHLDANGNLTMQFYDVNANVVNRPTFLNSLAFAGGTPPRGYVPDRLGDDGGPLPPTPNPNFRQRDVEYVFTARTVVTTPDLQRFGDASPASVSFTVYADREIGATDPVKLFVRE